MIMFAWCGDGCVWPPRGAERFVTHGKNATEQFSPSVSLRTGVVLQLEIGQVGHQLVFAGKDFGRHVHQNRGDSQRVIAVRTG